MVANIYVLFLFAYVVVVLLQLYGVRLFVHALRVPPHLLAVGILVMCAVGSFAIRNTLFDVGVMMVIGLARLFPAARAHSGGAGAARPGAGADAGARIAHGADHVGGARVDLLVVAAGADIFCARHPGDRRPCGRHFAGPGARCDEKEA